jgi:hypothetical protein
MGRIEGLETSYVQVYFITDIGRKVEHIHKNMEPETCRLRKGRKDLRK